MSNLLPDDSLTNAAEFTVSEISSALKRTVEDAFGNVRVRGEISGYRGPHSSGHAYFSLKDDRSRIEAVVWKGTFGRLKFRPEEGMEVIATGKLTTYAGSSKYQIVIDQLEPAGAGALMALLEERRRKLTAEGLFEDERKRALPYLPRVIGVVTSPTGAVIRDIIHRIADRFPLHVIVWPVRVQGETAGAEVAAAVDGFNALEPGGPIARPDLLIVARGGGSLEDLWGFNDEIVVRAVAASNIPVIAAVGHETDWTLIDHAADRRAPTPTGAAELAVPVKAELEATLANLGARLRGSVSRNVDRKRQGLRAASRALPSADQLLAMHRQRFDGISMRLGRGLGENTARKRARFSGVRLSSGVLNRRIADMRQRGSRAGARLPSVFLGLVENRKHRFERYSSRIEPVALMRRLERSSEKLTGLERRADRAFETRAKSARAKFDQTVRLIKTLSYEAALERGFALVRREDKTLVKRAGDIRSGEALSIQFSDGVANALALDEQAARPKPKPQAKPRDGGKQGDLF